MRVIQVHGINTKGTENTDRLAAALADRVLPVKYAPVNAIKAPRRVPEIARQVRDDALPGDAIVAYSLRNVTHPYDKALTAGKWLPWHPFGRLGRDGHAGVIHSRITEEQSTAEVGRFNRSAPKFSAEHVDFWSDRVRDFLTQHPSAG